MRRNVAVCYFGLFIVVLCGAPCFAQLGTINNAKSAQLSVEMDQLAQALEAYKQTRLEYPPCCATSEDAAKTRFMRHLDRAYSNAGYGIDAASFDALNQKIQATWGYNFLRSNSELALLDLRRLDPAEAIVFWLGGFPIPYDENKTRIANRKLFGFHRDEDSPFQRSLNSEKSEPLRFRTDPLFSFDESRLTDHDEDGWPEYAAGKKATGLFGGFLSAQPERFPPFVYFDAATYTFATPFAQLGLCRYPTEKSLAATWGTVGPYMQSFSPDVGAATWKKPQTFQIVCAGLDQKFGAVGTTEKLPPARVVEWGDASLRGFTADDDFKTPHEVDPSELDNQTNMAVKPLGEAIKQPVRP